MQVSGAHGLVVFGREVFGVVVGQIFDAGFPVDTKLTLADTISHPVKTHVDGFGAALFDCVVDDTGGAGVVNLDGRGRLRPTEINESGANGHSVLGIVEAGANLRFGGRCHDVAQDVADNVDRSIERWVWGCGVSGRFGAEEEETPSTGA